MGQSEIGISVDLDPGGNWWKLLVGVLAVIVAGVAIFALVSLVPGRNRCNTSSSKSSRKFSG